MAPRSWVCQHIPSVVSCFRTGLPRFRDVFDDALSPPYLLPIKLTNSCTVSIVAHGPSPAKRFPLLPNFHPGNHTPLLRIPCGEFGAREKPCDELSDEAKVELISVARTSDFVVISLSPVASELGSRSAAPTLSLSL